MPALSDAERRDEASLRAYRDKCAVAREDAMAAARAMTGPEAGALWYDWQFWARPEQLPPAGEWRTWLLLGGRGSGKTRPGAEAVRAYADAHPGTTIALVGPTSADCRDVMVEGESGLLACYPPAQRPEYKPSRRCVWFANGSKAYTYSAEEPERLRGPQHALAWLDEVAAYPDPKALWDVLIPGLRLGDDPRRICTTTPKPLRWLKDLIADPMTRTSRMRTADNRANLPPSLMDEFERLYGGTRIGRQELEGELLEEAEGALWKRAQIDALRVREAPDLIRVVVAIDPSVTSGPDSDECGIVAAGLGVDGHGYVLRDASGRMSPDDWLSRALVTYDALDGDKIIAETNNGGDLVWSLLQTQRRNQPYEKVHASRGKLTRAEPIAALYEQQKCHHVGGFPALEDEMTNYVAGVSKSPNRMDALVWALTYLMVKPVRVGRVLGI